MGRLAGVLSTFSKGPPKSFGLMTRAYPDTGYICAGKGVLQWDGHSLDRVIPGHLILIFLIALNAMRGRDKLADKENPVGKPHGENRERLLKGVAVLETTQRGQRLCLRK